MNTINKMMLLKIVLELEALGVSPETSAKALSEIYLDSLDSDYLAAFKHPEFVKLKTPNNVAALISWQSAYGQKIFGWDSEIERQLLQAKEKAFKNLSEVLGENFSVENAMRQKDNPHILALLGFIFYYGFDLPQNKQMGTDYLNHAATLSDVDALIWKLWAYPDKAKEILCEMAVLPNFMAEPSSWEVFKNHYGVKNLDISSFVIPKIGFIN